MKIIRVSYFIFLLFPILSCRGEIDSNTNTTTGSELYFPPNDGNATWQTQTPESLGWNTTQLQVLYDYLQTGDTRAFLVLKNGKIIIEKYWGQNITNSAAFNKDSYWYWASAGKTITALLVGIAQQEGKLAIQDKTSKYLGTGWTSEPLVKENLITVKNQLTMTTGLDYNIADLNCTTPSCLSYKADAGNQWYYHNAPYTMLEQLIQNATGTNYNMYCDQKLENTTGMSGQWITSGYNNVYYSTPRDMARFGLLILNKGKWKTTPLLTDANYYNEMTSTSQNLNPSYGYLWWLNGKSTVIFPGSPNQFSTAVTPNAPSDMISALGKNGQILDVIPSQNVIVIRMGNNPDNSEVPIQFHNTMWGYLKNVLPQ